MDSTVKLFTPAYEPVEVTMVFHTQAELNSFTTLIANWVNPGMDTVNLYNHLFVHGGVNVK